MNFLITSYKGGVGCSSLAYAMTLITKVNRLYSSDQFLIPDDMLVRIDNKKQFESIRQPNNLIMDFSIARDPALAKYALSLANVVLIPCQTDANGIKMAVQLYQDISRQKRRCVIVINGYRSLRALDQAKTMLRIAGVKTNKIIALKDTRLMDRLIANGPTWFNEVHNEKGLHKLRQTISTFEHVLRHHLNF